MGIKQKKEKKNQKKIQIKIQKKIQNGQLKKTKFFNITKSFPPKFQGLILGLVGFIDAKGIDSPQSICPFGWPM